MQACSDRLFATLGLPNPYTDFPYRDYPLDLQGGPPHPRLAQLVGDLRPSLIIEAGSWKGNSAVAIARALEANRLDTPLLCIDTWLGSVEHLAGNIPGWSLAGYRRHGYPTLHYQFLANVCHSGCQDRIVPVPNTTTTAARWLRKFDLAAELVYVDASHEEDDVYQDLTSFWPLLRPGGVMCGDDWDAFWYGVVCGVNRFVREHRLTPQIDGKMWLIRKPRV